MAPPPQADAGAATEEPRVFDRYDPVEISDYFMSRPWDLALRAGFLLGRVASVGAGVASAALAGKRGVELLEGEVAKTLTEALADSGPTFSKFGQVQEPRPSTHSFSLSTDLPHHRLLLPLLPLLRASAPAHLDPFACPAHALPSVPRCTEQALSCRPDIVGAKLAGELCSLQDQITPFDHAEALAIVREELSGVKSREAQELLGSIGDEAVAAASLGQACPPLAMNTYRSSDAIDRPSLRTSSLLHAAHDGARIGLLLILLLASGLQKSSSLRTARLSGVPRKCGGQGRGSQGAEARRDGGRRRR